MSIPSDLAIVNEDSISTPGLISDRSSDCSQCCERKCKMQKKDDGNTLSETTSITIHRPLKSVYKLPSAKLYSVEVSKALNKGSISDLEYLIGCTFSENCVLRIAPYQCLSSVEEWQGHSAIVGMYVKLLNGFPDAILTVHSLERFPDDNTFQVFGSTTSFSGTECFKKGWKNDHGSIVSHLDPEVYDAKAVRSIKTKEKQAAKKGHRVQMSIMLVEKIYIDPRSKKIVLHEAIYKISNFSFTDIYSKKSIY